MQISIIIPFYSRDDSISHCLNALQQALQEWTRKSPDSLYEVLVVDDASPFFPVAIEQRPHHRIIRLVSNQGVAKARNEGILAARYPWFLCLDSDVLVRANFFIVLEQILNSRPELNLIQGVMSHEVATKKQSLFSKYMALSFAFDTYEYLDGQGFAELLCSGCFCSKRRFFMDVGLFNTRFQGSGGEEFEILARLGRKQIYQSSELVADHIYDDFWPRMRKVFKRSEHYLEVAAFNSGFPPRLRVIGILRSLFTALATCFLLLGMILDLEWLIGCIICLILGALSDGGRQLNYLRVHGGPLVSASAMLFIYCEYTAAQLGMVLAYRKRRKRHA